MWWGLRIIFYGFACVHVVPLLAMERMLSEKTQKKLALKQLALEKGVVVDEVPVDEEADEEQKEEPPSEFVTHTSNFSFESPEPESSGCLKKLRRSFSSTRLSKENKKDQRSSSAHLLEAKRLTMADKKNLPNP